jgi:hypothetical protein
VPLYTFGFGFRISDNPFWPRKIAFFLSLPAVTIVRALIQLLFNLEAEGVDEGDAILK